MADQIPPFEPTIAFSAEEAHWLYQALQSSKQVITRTLFEKGIAPTDDDMYNAYSLLAERCLAFWIMNPPNKQSDER
jgi:hypothetical protein